MLPITLKAKYHALIIAFMPDRGEVSRINYINQVAAAVDEVFDPEEDITVQVEPELVVSTFRIMGYQAERLVASDNNAIKLALLPQLEDHPELLQEIVDIVDTNANETEVIRQRGIDFIMSINL